MIMRCDSTALKCTRRRLAAGCATPGRSARCSDCCLSRQEAGPKILDFRQRPARPAYCLLARSSIECSTVLVRSLGGVATSPGGMVYFSDITFTNISARIPSGKYAPGRQYLEV